MSKYRHLNNWCLCRRNKRCKEQSRASFASTVFFFFFFPNTHSWSCIMNPIQSGGLMECTIGDVSSKQCTACSLLLQRAVQFLLYYCDERLKKKKKTDRQTYIDRQIPGLDHVITPSQLSLPIWRSTANYSWQSLGGEKKEKSKQQDSDVNINGTRPKVKHTTFTWQLVPDRSHNFSETLTNTAFDHR